jgi:uncharacterized protein
LEYVRPFFLFNRHLETIYPSLLRHIEEIPVRAERISTPDDDFLDLYWSTRQRDRLVIILHGLEGSAERPYVRGMARAFFLNGYDVLAWNYRGCGEEMNRALRFYHSGETDDLHVVVQYAKAKGYREINLIGFSLGGNITLKYLGERHQDPVGIRKAVAFSVPMHLHTSCLKISRPSNLIYAQRFVRSLKEKVLRKSRVRKDLDTRGIEKIRTLIDFDDRYTAPLHGFRNAIHYYASCSSTHFISDIRTPVLIVNAENDPFLSPECYPNLDNHPYATLETPAKGGHVGFTKFSKNGLYWSEERAVDFIDN